MDSPRIFSQEWITWRKLENEVIEVMNLIHDLSVSVLLLLKTTFVGVFLLSVGKKIESEGLI